MITLEDMVGSGSVAPEGAELLRQIGRTRQSFIVYAIPRNAGKTTLTQAILAASPPDVPIRPFLGGSDEVETFLDERRGYLTVAEIGHAGMPGYLVGEQVVRAFHLVSQGWALASSLHADSVDGVFEALWKQGVGDAVVAIRYVAKVRALGDPNRPDTRRVVEEIHEVSGFDGPRAVTSLRYRWRGEGALADGML